MKTNQQVTTLALVMALFTSSFVGAQDITQEITKRKWNPQAKGTAIGAGVGGVAGAIIHKRDRKVGAGVGMAAGAIGGYAVGKTIDNRRKRAAAAARAAEDREFAARTARNDNNRELRSGTSNRSSSGVRSSAAAVRNSPQVAGVSNSAATRNSLLEPAAPVTIPLVRNGFLLNTSYGDPSTPYPTSEYRQKSW
jgi:hypothetical protein